MRAITKKLRSARMHQQVARLLGAAGLMGGCVLAPAGSTSFAATPLDDAALSAVTGRDGIVLNAHLELNTAADSTNRVSVGFKVAGATSYLVLDKISGTLDMLGLEVKAIAGPGGSTGISDVIQVGLPSFLGFKDFGIRAIAAQADATAPITASMGQIQLSGSAQLQGQVLLWSK
ncbi:hypothetical protein [Roseateles koreensis]|uniref:DUF4402 domain-containing protein n=1 Tax=Roseateles koreensis TaxID=2987526 RepID=A0ABT5KRP0_9BURK|nr:hypothetical protein [Roseateles koreensis]MDC8785033.1 hypothetical protein [Roseateles koreensis]